MLGASVVQLCSWGIFAKESIAAHVHLWHCMAILPDMQQAFFAQPHVRKKMDKSY